MGQKSDIIEKARTLMTLDQEHIVKLAELNEEREMYTKKYLKRKKNLQFGEGVRRD